MTRREWLGDNSKGIAILRVSSARQDGNASHETQRLEIAEYCATNALVLDRVFTITESAKLSENRKQYMEAMRFALAHDCRHVMFYMNDREARNLTDNEKNEQLVRSGLICLHYVRERRVLHQGSPDGDFLMRDYQAVQNKHLSRAISTKVQDSMRRKAESGVYPSNRPPLGYATTYAKGADGKRSKQATIIRDPDPRAIAQVMREFELRADGLGYAEIRRQILAEGLVPQHRAGRYHQGAIEHRLKNSFYGGEFTWQDKTYRGTHELIIPADIYRRARAVDRGANFTQRKVYADGHGVLAGGGWLRCICGCAMTYDPRKKTLADGTIKLFHFYHCNNAKRAHDSLAGMYIQEDDLWAQLGAAIDAIALPEGLADLIAARLNETAKESAGVAQRRIHALIATIKRLEELEDQAYSDLYAKAIDQDMFRRITAKAKRERHAAQDEKSALERVAKVGNRENAQSLIQLCKAAKSLFNSRSPRERRELLENVVSNLVCEGLTVRFDLKKPFCTLVEMKGDDEWWAHLSNLLTESADLPDGDLQWNRDDQE